MDDRERPPRKPIPLILWALIGFLLVIGFMFALRAMNAPAAGVGPSLSVPANPPVAPLPDAKPAT